MDKIVAFSTLVEIARARGQNRSADADALLNTFVQRIDAPGARREMNKAALKRIAQSLHDGDKGDTEANFFRSLAGC